MLYRSNECIREFVFQHHIETGYFLSLAWVRALLLTTKVTGATEKFNWQQHETSYFYSCNMVGHAHNTSPKRRPEGLMPKPLQLASFDVEELLCLKSPLND